jgi:hypothetical protein
MQGAACHVMKQQDVCMQASQSAAGASRVPATLRPYRAWLRARRQPEPAVRGAQSAASVLAGGGREHQRCGSERHVHVGAVQRRAAGAAAGAAQDCAALLSGAIVMPWHGCAEGCT